MCLIVYLVTYNIEYYLSACLPQNYAGIRVLNFLSIESLAGSSTFLSSVGHVVATGTRTITRYYLTALYPESFWSVARNSPTRVAKRISSHAACVAKRISSSAA